MRTSECQHHRLPRWTAEPYSLAWNLTCQHNSRSAEAGPEGGLVTLHYSLREEQLERPIVGHPRSELRREVPEKGGLTD